jgi:predicted permease
MTVKDDLRFALRRLRGRPLFVTIAVSTLALGIGFNSVIFSLLNTFLLRPLPIREPERVFSLGFGRDGTRPNSSYPDYVDIRDRNDVFTGVAAARVSPAMLGLRGSSSLIWGTLVSGNYFDLLGISPWRGRLLSPSDDVKTGAHPYVVLSYGCWQRRFGSDPQAVGRIVNLDGHPFTIVGVTPPGFVGTERLYANEFWVTLSMIREIEGRDWRPSRGTHSLWSIGRLKPGMGVAQAEASLTVVAAQIARENPQINEGFTIRLVPPGLFGNVMRKPFLGFGAALLMISGLTLLVACTNLSGLLLAHAADRRKELAIRLALGAGRAALVRLLLMESLLLALAGGGVSLLVTVWLRNGIRALIPAIDSPLNTVIGIDGRVAAFAMGAALVTAFLCGMLPAWRSARVELVPALKNDSSLGWIRGFHLRDVYVAVQVAVSVILLAGSLMMLRTLANALTVHYGFDPSHVVTVTTFLGMGGYDVERGSAFQQRLIERVRNLPGVEAAGIANAVPFSLDHSESTIYVEGGQTLSMSRMPSATMYICGPDYFRAAGTRLRAGREFTERDRADSPPVAIVNETFARKLLPGQDPIGKRFRTGTAGRFYQIVGVVEAGRYQTVTEDPQMAVWSALAQNYNSETTVVARTRLSEQETLTAIRQVMTEMDPGLALSARPMRDYMDLPLSPLRIATSSLVAMGGLGLLLSALGIYGLLAHSVTQRTREIAIRVALGARDGNILAATLRRTALLFAVSAGIGVAISSALLRVVGRLLYAQADFASYAPAALIFAAVAAIACFAPARRALRVDPAVALRSE